MILEMKVNRNWKPYLETLSRISLLIFPWSLENGLTTNPRAPAPHTQRAGWRWQRATCSMCVGACGRVPASVPAVTSSNACVFSQIIYDSLQLSVPLLQFHSILLSISKSHNSHFLSVMGTRNMALKSYIVTTTGIQNILLF